MKARLTREDGAETEALAVLNEALTAASAGAGLSISQAHIALLRDFRAALAIYDKLRAAMLSSLESGATISRGPLDLEIRVYRRIELNQATLRKTLGASEAAAILRRLPEGRVKQLLVLDHRSRR